MAQVFDYKIYDSLLESMVVIDSDGILDVDDLTEDVQNIAPNIREGGASGSSQLVGHSLEEIERYYIAETLKQTDGNREEASRLLGIGERTLYRKIKEYGID